MLTLYQFPISHYCEKVRWALDYKNLEYRAIDLLPGLHAHTAKKLSPTSSLPILVHDGKAIQNSSDIITYLDSQFTGALLTPTEEALKQEVMAWEKFADEEIGIAVRVICYHTLLDHPKTLIPLLTDNGPWYGAPLFKLIYPRFSAVMRKNMNLNAKTAEIANQKLGDALEKINSHLHNRQFLVGDQFTRADLAVASLLAPLLKPKQYGLTWPERYPEPLEANIAQHTEILAWVSKLYADHR
jgi:glutathione S-transferase